MQRKAQVIGQVLIYILAAVVIGAIVLLGYWAVKNMIEKTCQVEQINFKTKLESLAVKHSTYGSVNKDYLLAPCNYETVCFVDSRQIGNSSGVPGCRNKIIDQSVKDNDLKNIFLTSTKTTVPIGYSEYITLSNQSSCLCISQRSKSFFITFKGFNYRTELSYTTSAAASGGVP